MKARFGCASKKGKNNVGCVDLQSINKTQMETSQAKSSLKVCRRGDPLTCQRIWDVIKELRIERKLATTKENVVKEFCNKYNVEGKYVKEQLKLLVEDKLILQKTIAAVKGSKKGVEQNIFVIPLDSEIDLTGKSDWYCFQCHKPGEVLNCVSCPRVYHIRCLENLETENTEEFVCPICKEVKPDPNLEDEDVRRDLNHLVYYACARLEEKLPLEKYVWKQKALNENAATPHTTDRCAARLSKLTKDLMATGGEEPEKWRAKFLLRLPLRTVPNMIDRADRQVYKSLSEFHMDSLTIVHNITIFYGENHILADAARTMLRTCKFEIGEIHLCRDCYKRSNEPEGPDWFCIPCKPQHELVVAKAKGFPFWPAKVLSVTKDNQYNVRFFGHPHDRLTLDKIHTKPIDAIKAPPKGKRTTAWCKAVEELKKHQAMLASLGKSNDKSDDDVDTQDENVESPPLKKKKSSPSQPHLLKHCTVFLDHMDYPSLINKIDKRLEPIISGSELPFTEESVISQDESTGHAMLDLMILQDNPIFPEESETENAEKVMMDFRSPSATFSPSESNVELLAVREKMAAVQKDIDSKEKKIDGQEQLIKSQQKEIEALKESLASAIRSQQQEVETLKESLASAIRSQQQEVETLKESQASEIRVLMANHAEEIARTKTKVWCSNLCGSEGIYHCCVNVSYCSTTICQLEHWRKGHKRTCRRRVLENTERERESTRRGTVE